MYCSVELHCASAFAGGGEPDEAISARVTCAALFVCTAASRSAAYTNVDEPPTIAPHDQSLAGGNVSKVCVDGELPTAIHARALAARMAKAAAAHSRMRFISGKRQRINITSTLRRQAAELTQARPTEAFNGEDAPGSLRRRWTVGALHASRAMVVTRGRRLLSGQLLETFHHLRAKLAPHTISGSCIPFAAASPSACRLGLRLR